MDKNLYEEQGKNFRFGIALQMKDNENTNLLERCKTLVKEKESLKRELKEREHSIVFARVKKDQEMENLKRGYCKTLEDLKISEEQRERTSRELENAKEELEKLRKKLEILKTEKEFEKKENRYRGMSKTNDTDHAGHSLWIKRVTELQNKYDLLEKENQELKKNKSGSEMFNTIRYWGKNNN
ncbi:uncharacterized protein LOC134257038 [Saccostrea cucullata]|uniref:uncharacterized protein LOC134257038 n=1 Tax=Saccostrea cuccullata TaxID=36930 RepID=UPI002ED6AB31